MLKDNPRQVLRAFLESGISLLFIYSVVPVFIKAFGIDLPLHIVMGRMCLINLVLYFTPTPGGSGVAEGGFLVLFNSLLPPGTAGVLAILWRFFCEYIPFTMRRSNHQMLWSGYPDQISGSGGIWIHEKDSGNGRGRFIGSHVVPALLGRGDCEVTVLDNLSTGKRAYVPEGARFRLMDIRSRELTDFLMEEKFQTVIHLAAQTLVPYSMEHPEADEDLSVTGLVHVLEGCRKSGVEQIIFSSSAAIYGDNQNLPLLETEVPAPTSFYGLSKAVGEDYIRLYSRCFGLKHIIFRFANVYGERQGETGEGGVISVFARKIARKEPVTVFGDGNQTRDFVYAGDIARAMSLGVGYAAVPP